MEPIARKPPIARAVEFVQKKLLAGFFAVFPLAVTVLVLRWLLGKLDNLLGRYLAHYRFPGLGIFLLFLILLLAGMVVSSIVGRKLFALYEAVLTRVPLARALYTGSKQLAEALSPEGRKGFQRVVLVEYPRKGLYAIGFVTRESVGEVQSRTKERVSNVFLPTTPNPTSGVLLLVPEEEMTPLSMSVEDGIKLIVSGGLISPDYEGERAAPVETL